MAEIKFPKNLTEVEQRSLGYLNYPTRPLVYSAENAVATEQIRREGDNIILQINDRMREEMGIEAKEVIVDSGHQFSMVEPTLEGLFDALQAAEGGIELKERFEVERAEAKTEDDEVRDNYGNWVFYPRTRNLFHYASREWTETAMCLSNSVLFSGPDRVSGFAEIREKLAKPVWGFVGLSVGRLAAEAYIQGARPDRVKVADPAVYKLTNLNRVEVPNQDMVLSEAEKRRRIHTYGLRYKWQVFSEHIHSMDPFMDISAYPEVNSENMGDFIHGNRVEPALDGMVEICDTLGVKIGAPFKMREAGKCYIRGSDIGQRFSVDVMPWHLDKSIPITVGKSDEELMQIFKLTGKNRETFLLKASALVGDVFNNGDVFGALMKGEIPAVSSSIAQLGATARMLGGFIGLAICNIEMGRRYPLRIVADFQNFIMTVIWSG